MSWQSTEGQGTGHPPEQRGMRPVRMFGAFIVVVGGVLLGAGFLGISVNIDFLSAGMTIAPSALMVGGLMVFAPGTSFPPPGRFDFVEWFDCIPLREKLRFYIATALGFVMGNLLLWSLSDWSPLDLVLDA